MRVLASAEGPDDGDDRTTVSVLIDGLAVLGHVFNAVVVDGDFGLITRGDTSSFETVHLKTDDPALAPPLWPRLQRHPSRQKQ